MCMIQCISFPSFMCNNIRECRLWFHEPINRALICSILYTSIRKYFSSHVLVLFFVLSFITRYQHECSAYFLEVFTKVVICYILFSKVIIIIYLVLLFAYKIFFFKIRVRERNPFLFFLYVTNGGLSHFTDFKNDFVIFLLMTIIKRLYWSNIMPL